MRGLRPLAFIVLAMAATQAEGKRSPPPAFAEPGDIIAAEGNFSHVSAAKGIKAAIKATAAPDAQIFAPQLLRVADYANRPIAAPASWHTRHLWMSCDGSAAVTHGTWQRSSAIGWYVTIWRRQKSGGYKWVLEQGGPLSAAPPEFDMISASVADCPARRAHGAPIAPSPPDHGKPPAADYTSGHADDGTLAWDTAVAADGGRIFTLQLKQDSTLHEVLRAAAPAGG